MRKLLCIEQKSFKIGAADEEGGRFLRVVERGRGSSKCIFVERGQVGWLASMLEDFVVEDRTQSSKEGKCQNLWAGRRQNTEGQYVKVIERVQGGMNHHVCIPMGVSMSGWRTIRKFLIEVQESCIRMEREEKARVYGRLRNEKTSYKMAAQITRCAAEGSCEMRKVEGHWIIRVVQKGMEGRLSM